MWTRLLRLTPTGAGNLLCRQQIAFCVAQQRHRQITQRVRVYFASEQRDSQNLRSFNAAQTFDTQSAEHSRDTIAALSSGAGRCGVALLRVSGPEAGIC